MSAAPRGWYASWGLLAAGAAALVAFQAAHHGVAGSPHAGAAPSISTPSAPPAPAVRLPATGVNMPPATGPSNGPSGIPAAALPSVSSAVVAARASGSPTSSRTPTPGHTPSPTPAPRRPSPVLGVVAAVVVPVRASAPLAVRAVVAVGAAPPFPTPHGTLGDPLVLITSALVKH